MLRETYHWLPAHPHARDIRQEYCRVAGVDGRPSFRLEGYNQEREEIMTATTQEIGDAVIQSNREFLEEKKLPVTDIMMDFLNEAGIKCFTLGSRSSLAAMEAKIVLMGAMGKKVKEGK